MVQDYNLVLWKTCTWPVILTVFGAKSAKTIGSECNKTNERTVLQMVQM